MMINTFAKTSSAISDLERANAAIARRAAAECMVLLKNEGCLPMSPAKIALFGEGAAFTIKGGTGSGETSPRHVVSIREGLEKAGFAVSATRWLDDYERTMIESKAKYKSAMRKKSGLFNFATIQDVLTAPFINPPGRLIEAPDLTSPDETCFYVISRQTGESVDRSPTPGDFCLTLDEVANIRKCSEHYKNTVVVINAGGYVDLSPLDDIKLQGIIFFCQQGAEGGHAFADIVAGVSPSGKLAATWPKTYADVPFGEKYGRLSGDTDADYLEGIYVGYRYYDSFDIIPRYEFGYGLSYTDFEMKSQLAVSGRIVTLDVDVANVGDWEGKSVVQVYASCPQGRLDKEYQRLAGFAKTEAIAPGQSQMVTITFDMSALASYDIKKSQTVLEKGDYVIKVGESSRKTAVVALLRLAEDVVISQHMAICPLKRGFEDLQASAAVEQAPNAPMFDIPATAFETVEHKYQDFVPLADEEVVRLLQTLTNAEKMELCVGSGLDIAIPKPHYFMVPGAAGYSATKLEKRGIPAVSFCDGPAGLRLFDVSVTKGKTVRMVNPALEAFDVMPWVARKVIFGNPKKGRLLYQYATSFPVGTALAQSWNMQLAQEVGRAIQSEMECFGAVYWLGPGMNIQRNPLCGRNYEYFSEDPLLSGSMSAAIVRGVQSKPGYYATIKHFVANNQEANRKTSSSNLSERALREIYLRGFEIAVRAGVKCVMTSYNKVNGIYTSESHDLCTKTLRNEWGFKGLVITDWTTTAYMLNSAKAMMAGVNLMMPGISSDRRQIKRALIDKTLPQSAIDRNATCVLAGIVQSDVYRIFKQV